MESEAEVFKWAKVGYGDYWKFTGVRIGHIEILGVGDKPLTYKSAIYFAQVVEKEIFLIVFLI